MTREELDLIPDKVMSGRISWKQAVNDLVVFIIRNKPMFGLTKFDEDFISDVVINFLDRGEASLKLYDKEKGQFFPFLFCFVTNICNTVKKNRANNNMIENHTIKESIANYNFVTDAYQNIKYEELEYPKIPYKYTPISYKDFQIACKTDSYHIKRIISTDNSNFARIIKDKLKHYSPNMIQNMIMVLALKSAYYITEEQIERISYYFNIDSIKLHQIIQEIKEKIEPRKKNRIILEERRNNAYFQISKIKNLIEWNESHNINAEYPNRVLKKKYQKNEKTVNTLNQQLLQGKILIRPTSKLISEILGLSLRQVTYYQSLARKLDIDICKV